MTKDKKVLPCPFCGSKPVPAWDERYADHWRCENPHCPIAYVDIPEEQWNTCSTPEGYVLVSITLLDDAQNVIQQQSERISAYAKDSDDTPGMIGLDFRFIDVVVDRLLLAIDPTCEDIDE